mgnify:FL=1
MIVIITDEDFENLITSYDFITKMEFTSKDQVKLAIEYCMDKDRLTEDTLNYLLDKLQTLPHELETTQSNQDWKTAGISAN